MSKINDACRMALTRALIWDARVSCLDSWAHEAKGGPHGHPVDYTQLRQVMMAKSLDAWRDAMMWGVVSNKVREEVKQAAANRFLKMDGSVKSAVMRHLSLMGEPPGKWKVEAERAFREEIRRALGTVPEEESAG